MSKTMPNFSRRLSKNTHYLVLATMLAVIPISGQTASEIIFTEPVDHRYAWIGNEARGDVDFKVELINMIRASTTSIDVSTMSFGGVEEIADELALAASKGVRVRILGNGGHRHGMGYMRALRGPVQLADNNLPALLYRINFQRASSPVPAGFLVDSGQPFGPRGGGLNYGWSQDMTGSMRTALTTTLGLGNFTSSLLGDAYARANNLGQVMWEIEVPNGYYYVNAVVGQAGFASQTHLTVENQPIFFDSAPGFGSVAHTGIGEFEGANVDGGQAQDGDPAAKRIQVSDGRLTVAIGNASASAWSSLDFIEIYKGSSAPYGNNGTDKTMVQERQLQHAKYLIFDAGQPTRKLWASSGNLTAGMTYLSEDALITNESAAINAFLEDFEHRWGGSSATPNASAAVSGTFKPAVSVTDITVNNPNLGSAFNWKIRFSPSNATYNLYDVLGGYIDGAQHDLIFNLEQLTDSGNLDATHLGTNALMSSHLDPFVSSGKLLYGLFGNEDPTDSIFSRYAAYPNAIIRRVPTVSGSYGIHTKAVLRDALHDTRCARRGQILMGSMNWSQAGMHINDEQTFVIEDPSLANQYLQRAMAALAREGIAPREEADIVLVLDRSYSMNDPTPSGTTKIEATRAAATLFVDLLDQSGSNRAGLVRFGEVVEPFSPPITLQPLTPAHAAVLTTGIDGTVADLPIGNATAYGLGLQAALAEFNSVPTPKPRRLIHFFTDGKENRPPWASQVDDALIAAGIEIHSTAFGNFDPNGSGPTAILADMAAASGGTFAQVPDDAVSLKKRFAEVARDSMNMSTILDPTFRIDRRRGFQTTFLVDEGMKSLKVLGLWDRPVDKLATLTLTTPAGHLVNASNSAVRLSNQKGQQVWHVDLLDMEKQGSGTVGKWTVTGKADKGFVGEKAQKVDIMVLGQGGVRMDAEAYPLKPDSGRIRLLARAMEGGKTLRNVRMLVHWTPPLGSDLLPQTIALYDDGKHKDMKALDGIYGNVISTKATGSHTFRFVSMETKKLTFQREAVRQYFVKNTRLSRPVATIPENIKPIVIEDH